MKLGKRGKLSQKTNKILKKKFLDMDITRCEYPGCGSDFGLTFAHRFKRRDMQTLEELTDTNNVLLLCLKHHQLIEYDKEATEELFRRLRQ